MVASAAEAGRPPTSGELGASASASFADAARWDRDATTAFLRILRCGDAGVTALEALDRLDLLAQILPWADVRCRPQRDPYHRFTVDVHLLDALGRMATLLAGEVPADDLVAAEAVRQIDDDDAVLLGALLHDIGEKRVRAGMWRWASASPALPWTGCAWTGRPATSSCSWSRITCSCRTRPHGATSPTTS